MARVNSAKLTGKTTFFARSIVKKYREGKVKRTPIRGVK